MDLKSIESIVSIIAGTTSIVAAIFTAFQAQEAKKAVIEVRNLQIKKESNNESQINVGTSHAPIVGRDLKK